MRNRKIYNFLITAKYNYSSMKQSRLHHLDTERARSLHSIKKLIAREGRSGIAKYIPTQRFLLIIVFLAFLSTDLFTVVRDSPKTNIVANFHHQTLKVKP